jgi:hypothetical protein
MFAGFEILPDLVFPRKGLLPDNAEFGHGGTIIEPPNKRRCALQRSYNGRRYG